MILVKDNMLDKRIRLMKFIDKSKETNILQSFLVSELTCVQIAAKARHFFDSIFINCSASLMAHHQDTQVIPLSNKRFPMGSTINGISGWYFVHEVQSYRNKTKIKQDCRWRLYDESLQRNYRLYWWVPRFQ